MAFPEGAPGEERPATAAGGQADHGFRLTEDGLIGRDDEVGAYGDLTATAVGHPVYRGDDGPT